MSLGGDRFSRVSGGDPLKISARWYNGVTEAAQRLIRGGLRPESGANELLHPHRSSTTISLVNTTGDDIPQFGIMKVDAPAILPAIGEVQFESLRIFDGIASAPTGVFAIAQETIRKNGGVGRAVVAGVTPCFLSITDSGDEYAGPTTSIDKLATGTSGPARIIWKESATGSNVRAVVLLTGTADASATSGGGGGVPTFSGARVYNSANIGMDGLGTFQLITFDSEDIDTDGYHSVSSDTGRLTVPVNGFYEIGFCFAFSPTAARQQVGAYAILNGDTTNGILVEDVEHRIAGATSDIALGGSTVFELAAGDYVEMFTSTVAIVGYPANLIKFSKTSPVFWITHVGQ